MDVGQDLGVARRCSVHILNPQWRQAAGKIGAGMVIEFCSPLAGWGLGRFPAPTAFFVSNAPMRHSNHSEIAT
jgi:hypothetical protein